MKLYKPAGSRRGVLAGLPSARGPEEVPLQEGAGTPSARQQQDDGRDNLANFSKVPCFDLVPNAPTEPRLGSAQRRGQALWMLQ